MSKPSIKSNGYSMPIIDVNTYADVLGTSPAYHQKETQRWNTAIHIYQHMAQHNGEASSPPNSPVSPAPPKLALKITDDKKDVRSKSPLVETDEEKSTDSPSVLMPINSVKDQEVHMPSNLNECPSWPTIYSNMYSPDTMPFVSLPTSKYGFMTPPVRPPTMSAPRMGGSYVTPTESSLNSLELEAIAAVHELQFAVKDIFVSELLPRTSELIFLNLTTLEGQAYCVELTMKGWRVTSLRHDCMNGDYNNLHLHVRYFETIYALMDTISIGYRCKFFEALSLKLTMLQKLDDHYVSVHQSKSASGSPGYPLSKASSFADENCPDVVTQTRGDDKSEE